MNICNYCDNFIKNPMHDSLGNIICDRCINFICKLGFRDGAEIAGKFNTLPSTKWKRYSTIVYELNDGKIKRNVLIFVSNTDKFDVKIYKLKNKIDKIISVEVDEDNIYCKFISDVLKYLLTVDEKDDNYDLVLYE